MSFLRRFLGQGIKQRELPQREISQSTDAASRASEEVKQLYEHGTDLFRRDRFREAASALERAAELDSRSAAIRYVLALCYSRMPGEFDDETAVLPWLTRSIREFDSALQLAKRYGGLGQQQRELAHEAVEAWKRISKQG